MMKSTPNDLASPRRRSAVLPRVLAMVLVVPALVATGLLTAGGAYAAPPAGSVVDQSNETGSGLSFVEVEGSNEGEAQTFTAGKSGMLTAVDINILFLSPSQTNGALTVAITGTAADGTPSGPAMGSGTIAAGFTGITTVVLDTPVPVISGDHYAITLQSANFVEPAYYIPANYSGGVAYRGKDSAWRSNSGASLWFATYVDQSANAVPTLGTAPTATIIKGRSYSYAYTTGGSPSPDVTLSSGALPPGLQLSNAGVLSGTPTSTGTFFFDVTANNGVGTAATVDSEISVRDAVVPDAPTIGSATPGDGRASVGFTPPTNSGDSPITSYTVTSSPGNVTASGTTSPIAVTGLTDGTAYTFTVTANSIVGPSLDSGATAPVTPRTTPGAPSGLQAVGSDGLVDLSWSPPTDNGGADVTDYDVQYRLTGTATWTDDGDTTALTAEIPGLMDGPSYDFQVKAINPAGGGAWSDVATATPFVLVLDFENAAGHDITGTTLLAGSKVTIVGSDLPAGATVSIDLHSTPVKLATTNVAVDGTFRVTVTIPSTTPAGSHQLVATITGNNVATTSDSTTFAVSEELGLTGSPFPWIALWIALFGLVGVGVLLRTTASVRRNRS